jgi:uncharacterized protein
MARLRVGVVGGGIAGAAAAWSLARAGHEVELFEAAAQLGGNARTHTCSAGAHRITAGVAVLAWPDRYFHNYGRLLETLGIPTEPVRLRFFVRRGDEWFAHDRGGPLARRHEASFGRWRRLVERVRAYNRRFVAGAAPSLYHVSFRNPLTWVPARTLARASGITRAFWDELVVAIYSSSFLTVRLDSLPAAILPVIDDLISIERGGEMRSWRGHAGEVFDAMLEPLGARVHRGRAISHVRGGPDGVTLRDLAGSTHRYDRVVLAGDAGRMADALDRQAHKVERALLSRVRYVDRRDTSFLFGVAHADAGVLPEAHRAAILRDCCTFVDVTDDPAGGLRHENHFVVSSWAPAFRDTGAVLIVSYDATGERRLAGPIHRFSNRGAHPEMSVRNLLLSRALGRYQGRRGVYHCGAHTTPGNGHDLSLLSGFVVASAIGAPHPFADHPPAAEDFARLRALMLGAQAAS